MFANVMIKIFFSVLILIFVRIAITKNIECDNPKSFEVSNNQIVFFESPNFPMAIDTNAKEKCKLNFTGDVSDKENMLLIFVITNGYISTGIVKFRENDTFSVTQSNKYFFTNASSLLFFFDDTKVINGHEAFQGFVTSELYRKDCCFLGGRNEPYKFQNESEIYYFRSHYTTFYDETMIQRRCLWEFTADLYFGFMLEIHDISVLNVAKLYIVTNNSRSYVTSPSVNYYSDSYIAISYEGQKEAFEATISIFKLPKKFDYADECIFDNKTMIWKSNSINSYGNKIHCLKTFNILPFHELHVNTDFILNETGNSLTFYSDSRRLFPVKMNRTGDFVFLPNSNGTVRSLTFEYISAENVINKDFMTEFKDISCTCGPKIHVIPCTENNTFSIMEDSNIFAYCADIMCIFEIKLNETCSNRYIDLNIMITNARHDYLSIKSVNDWLINTTHNSTLGKSNKNYKLLILPNSTATLHFKSYFVKNQEWLNIAQLTFKTAVFDEPKRLPDEIMSIEGVLAYTDQLDRHSVLTIKLSDDLLAEKAIMELVFDSAKLKMLKCLSFFKYRNLTSFIRMNTEITLMEIGTSITVYKHNGCKDDEPIFVIRVKKPGANECLFKNVTVINNGDKPLSMVAGPNNTCKFHILNCAMSSVIKKMYTNSKIADVVLYIEYNEIKELIRFNESMAKFYNQMTFNARSYVMEIPANTSIYIEPTEDDPCFTEPTFAYYETPKYGALNANRPDLTTTYNIANYLEANFSVYDFNISSTGFTGENDYFIVNGKNDNIVKIVFSDHEFGYSGALLYIKVYYTNAESQQITTVSPTKIDTIQDFSNVIKSEACFPQNNLKLFFLTTVFWITVS